ncbi:RHTO0S26e00914g1_1 [Rhodotorula toruloides]|uniref:RHTO0S26e00914g1_1 n=2 Tax=Rhodotorula toruloides TaxID=5286 RepID=A0A061BN36_RHOTO|nr:RNA 3'-terminal phosphate cyclase-like protein [Rhodotorula toruloides NP11]EMS21323.1 RNA 3'-terminal phosphate cyclase-like protein [Rhodotorula toruloides NP11]CDR49399.1 RHTO0S26e00914g1_1 [Rhodotorula toruloides]
MAAQRLPPSSASSSSTTHAPTSSSRVLHFTGHARFRHRLVLSLLSRRPVRIDRIRPDDDNPGLRVYEVSFLRLVEKLTQGSRVEISYTGTSVLFHPGTIQNGQITHQCPLERGVGWFLEPLLAIAPFGKKDLSLTLRGVTTDGRDASVDVVRTSGLPHLAMFLDKEGVELRITKRGHPPLGGGEVTLTCPSVRAIKSGFEFTSLGRISKIRGIAHSVRVSPQLANRLVASARSVLNRYIPDIYIYTDVYRGEDSGKSPGYAITLVASSTSHVLHSSESSSCPSPSSSSSSSSTAPQTPEDLGILAARALLSQIARGGCVDRGWEWLVTTLLVLGGEDVGKVRVAGPLDAALIAHLRDLKAFFGTTFKIKPVPSLPSSATADAAADDDAEGANGLGKEREEYVLSCVGTGFVNTARRAG